MTETFGHSHETGLAVVAALKARGEEATYEYPGFIALRGWAFGTVNGDWGGNDEEGSDGVDLDIPGDSTDAEAIATAILAALASKGVTP